MCIGPGTLSVSLIGLLNDCALIQKQVFLILCNLLELLCILYSVWQLLLCMCSYSLYTHLNSFAVVPACISLTDKLLFFSPFVMSLYFSCSLDFKRLFYKLFLYWPSVFARTISLTVAAYKPHGINPFFHTQKANWSHLSSSHKTWLSLYFLEDYWARRCVHALLEELYISTGNILFHLMVVSLGFLLQCRSPDPTKVCGENHDGV